MSPPPRALTCPSAQPDMAQARVIGLISGEAEATRIAYLKRGARLDPEFLPEIGGLDPMQVFRFAAACESERCAQFKDGRCGLGDRIVAGLAPVVEALPACQIRRTCRWREEQGGAACLRCPQVVTLVPRGDGALGAVAAPPA